MIRIGLDGMGGDNAPVEIVKGAVEAAEKFNGDEIIYIFGDEKTISDELCKYKYDVEKIHVVYWSFILLR